MPVIKNVYKTIYHYLDESGHKHQRTISSPRNASGKIILEDIYIVPPTASELSPSGCNGGTHAALKMLRGGPVADILDAITGTRRYKCEACGKVMTFRS